MKLTNVYVMYDSVAEEYSLPFFAVNDGLAKRMAKLALKNVEADVLGDFKLFGLGSFDMSTGQFELNTIKYEVEDFLSISKDDEVKKNG